MDDRPGVVLDAGVVLQAALRPRGPAGGVVSLLDRSLFTLYVSAEGLVEFADILARPEIRRKNPHLTDELAAAILTRVRAYSILVTNVPVHFRYPRDPDDEHVINLAIEAKLRYLVSRDNDLLDLSTDVTFEQSYRGLRIVDPVVFLQVWTSEQRSSDPLHPSGSLR